MTHYRKGKPVKHPSYILNSIDVGNAKQQILVRGKNHAEANKLTDLLLSLLNAHHEENVKEYVISKAAIALKDTMPPEQARETAEMLYRYNLLQL